MDSEEQELLLKFGNRLRFLRIQKNLSQEKFADLTHLDRTYISGLERGKRNPSFLILKKIASVLEIEPQEFFKGEDK